MRRLAAVLFLLTPATVLGQTVECLSIDGQLRINFQGDALTGVTIRMPGGGRLEARTLRMAPSDVVLKILSETNPNVLVEGCAGEPKGTIAVVRTTTVTTRRIRLGFPDGGAFPPNVIGRSAEGDTLERDMTCSRSESAMAVCP